MTDMYADKEYRRRDANRLLSYLNRTNRPIRDRSGREMSSDDIQMFIDTSGEYEYEESWIFSPKRGDELSAAEISLAVRKTMREHMEDRQRATYCYSIHTDDNNNHAHIAATGASDDLWTDVGDLDRMRDLGAEYTREQERDRARDRKQERDREREREQERDRDRGRGK